MMGPKMDGYIQCIGWRLVLCGWVYLMVMMCLFSRENATFSAFVRKQHSRQLADSSPSQPKTKEERQYHYPIILLGLPNSGSLQIHEYFHCLGLTSRHYCCDSSLTSGGVIGTSNLRDHAGLNTGFPCTPFSSRPKDMNIRTASAASTSTSRGTCGGCVLDNMKQNNDPFRGCDNMHATNNSSPVHVWASFDLETRDEWFLPQHFAIGLLHQAYPQATWILNRRASSKAWAKTILPWYSKTRRFFASYRLALHPHAIPEPPDPNSKVTTQQLLNDMQDALEERLHNHTDHLRKMALLEHLYDNHTTLVRSWSRQFPLHHMIELNVDSPSEQVQAMLRGILSDDDVNAAVNKKCYFKAGFDLQSDDWNGFRLPFL